MAQNFRQATQALKLGIASATLYPHTSVMCFQLIDGSVGCVDAASQSVSPLALGSAAVPVADSAYRPRKFASKMSPETKSMCLYYGTVDSALNCAELDGETFRNAEEGVFRGDASIRAKEVLEGPRVRCSVACEEFSVACVAAHPLLAYLACGTDDNRLLVAAADHTHF